MKKLFITITLFLVLVGSVFAVDWKEYKTDKDEIGEYKVYFDFDATEIVTAGALVSIWFCFGALAAMFAAMGGASLTVQPCKIG